MSEALAAELGPQGIGVSVLCPGPVATDIIARTRAGQPKVARTLSAEQRTKVFARHEEMINFLANGVQPDAVGEMVRAAISDDRLFIHTDRSSIDAIEQRSSAQIAAFSAVPAA
jgi:NAD(P)-dependent dehydrogenase (short-subunit alcohol dehydrogenase family)